MDRRSTPPNADATRDASPPEVRIEALHKAFNGNPVLRGVDLEIRRADIVAIVGGSGCGKTVLLNHMIGVLRPDSGRVWIADHSAPDAPLVDLWSLDEDAMDRVRLHWAVVFQKNALFSGTVYENIALWLRENKRTPEDQILAKAHEALRAVGFKNIDELLNKDRDELSGGMAKRVAMARALAMDPTIVFYDEPTTGLDPSHAGQIHELIGATHDAATPDGVHRTTIIVTHDRELLRRIRPRIVMLHEGRVYFDDVYEQFERSPSQIIRPYFEQMSVLQMREWR